MDRLYLYLFAGLAYCGLLFYNIRAFQYCRDVLDARRPLNSALWISCLLDSALFTILLFLDLPILLNFLLIYLLTLLQFFLFFQGSVMTFLFSTGTFLFHIMNLTVLTTSLFILLFQIPSYERFQTSGLYNAAVFFALLLVLIFLEVFGKLVDRKTIQLLMNNRSQLYFVTSSITLINVYLLILSVSYNSQVYSSLASVFMLCTSVLLFGAFYTSFRHAVKMSLMTEYQRRSQALEQQLQQSNQNLAAMQNAVYSDTLTDVHNRRYGLEALSALLEQNRGFCSCYIDIDHLKTVNDTYGHSEGDQYILNVVRILSGVLPAQCSLSRLGGDEFLALLPEFSYDTAYQTMQAASERVRQLPVTYRASISYGVVEVGSGTSLTASEILQMADQRMYACKARSRPA